MLKLYKHTFNALFRSLLSSILAWWKTLFVPESPCVWRTCSKPKHSGRAFKEKDGLRGHEDGNRRFQRFWLRLHARLSAPAACPANREIPAGHEGELLYKIQVNGTKPLSCCRYIAFRTANTCKLAWFCSNGASDFYSNTLPIDLTLHSPCVLALRTFPGPFGNQNIRWSFVLLLAWKAPLLL